MELPAGFELLQPKRVLDVLAEAVTAEVDFRAGKRQQPLLVALYLATGRELHGRLLGLDANQREPMALLAVGDERFATGVVHVNVASILAVGLSGGGVNTGVVAALPADTSKLGLQRRLRDLQPQIAALFTPALTIDVTFDGGEHGPRALDVLALLLEQTVQVLTALATDAFSRGEIARQTRLVRLALGPTRVVARDGDTLRIVAAGPMAAQTFADVKDLKAAIERVY